MRCRSDHSFGMAIRNRTHLINPYRLSMVGGVLASIPFEVHRLRSARAARRYAHAISQYTDALDLKLDCVAVLQ